MSSDVFSLSLSRSLDFFHHYVTNVIVVYHLRSLDDQFSTSTEADHETRCKYNDSFHADNFIVRIVLQIELYPFTGGNSENIVTGERRARTC